MSEWKPYLDSRLRKNHPLGFAIIIPNETGVVVPLSCPVCSMMLSTSEDSEYFREKKCCYKCGIKWADQNKELWNSGWRPSTESIEEEVKERQSFPVCLNLDTLSR